MLLGSEGYEAALRKQARGDFLLKSWQGRRSATTLPSKLSNRPAPANFVGQSAKDLVILVPGNPQGGGAENFGVIRRGEFAVIHQYQLIKNQAGHALQLGHENRMHAHRKTIFRTLPFGGGMRELAQIQRPGVKNDLARVADTGAVFENPKQFLPADVRAVLCPNLPALHGYVPIERLPGVFSGELDGHKVTVLKI